MQPTNTPPAEQAAELLALHEVEWLKLGSTERFDKLKKDVAHVCRDVTNAGCIDEICINDIAEILRRNGYYIVESRSLVETIQSLRSTIAALTEEKAKILEEVRLDDEFNEENDRRLVAKIDKQAQRISTLEQENAENLKLIDRLNESLQNQTKATTELVDEKFRLKQERDGLRAKLDSKFSCFRCNDDNTPLYCLNCAESVLNHPVTAMRQALEWSLDRLTDAVGNKIYGGATIEQIEEHSKALSLPTCGDSDKERVDWLEANWNLFIDQPQNGNALRAAIDSAKKGQSDE